MLDANRFPPGTYLLRFVIVMALMSMPLSSFFAADDSETGLEGMVKEFETLSKGLGVKKEQSDLDNLEMGVPPPPVGKGASEREYTGSEKLDMERGKTKQKYIDFILNRKDSRWNAEILHVAGDTVYEESEDCASASCGDAWDFDEDDFEGIDGVRNMLTEEQIDSSLMSDDTIDALLGDTADSPNMEKNTILEDSRPEKRVKKPWSVKNGMLRFTTGKNACFFWGDYFGDHPEYGTESFGKGQRCPKWRVIMRVRQTELSSHWRVGAVSEVTGKRAVTAFPLSGREWQTKSVVLPGGVRSSLCIMPGGKENFVEIDWIKFVPYGLTKYFRKTFVLDEGDIRSAPFYMWNESGFRLYINGRKAFSPGYDRYGSVALRHVDLSEYLVKGSNTFAVMAGTHEGNDYQQRNARRFFMEGMVLFKSGRYQRVFTDKTWKATYVSGGKGWEMPGFDDSKWKAAVCKGTPASTGFSAKYMPGSGYFVNPPYIGPIALDYGKWSQPIFKMGEKAIFNVRLPKRMYTDHAYDVRYTIDEITSELDQHTIDEGNIATFSSDGDDQVYNLEWDPKQAGVYEIHVTVNDRDGKPVDKRTREFVVVAQFDQPEVDGESFEEGMELKLVDSIDCAADYDTREFVAAASFSDPVYSKGRYKNVATEVVEKPFGKYRQLKVSTPWARLGYKLTVKNPGRPHVVEVEYPDDARRALVCFVSEYPIKGDRLEYVDYRRASAGVYVGGSYAPTQSLKKLKILFWPRQHNVALDLHSNRSGCRVAASGIRVYEIMDELPALRIKAPRKGRRIGGQTERDTILVNNFYAGSLGYDFSAMSRFPRRRFYYDWYQTLGNLTKYLRFCGQNVFFSGAYMYEKALYPTETYGNGTIFTADYRGLMARMFECNGIDLVLSVQMAKSRPWYAQDDYSDAAVAAGKPTLRLVSRDGEQARNGLTKAGFNWFSSQVHDVALGMLRELVEYYREYPALKGVALYTGQSMYPCLCLQTSSNPKGNARGTDFGYGDMTVARFEKESGVDIPTPDDDPKRFGKRYEWLKANAWETWMNWRCAVLSSNVVQAAELIRGLRSDLVTYAIGVGPMTLSRSDWLKGNISYREACRERGIDPTLCHSNDAIVGFVSQTQAGDWTGMSRIDGIPSDLTEGVIDVMGENPVGMYYPRNVAPHGWGMMPGSVYTAIDYARALCFITPVVMVYGKADTMYMLGGEQELRTFARAYRSLPPGEYRDVNPDGMGEKLTLRAMNDDKQFVFYVVNMSPDPVALSVNIKKVDSARVKDLVADSSVGTAGKDSVVVPVSLGSFGVGVFSVDDPDAGILSVTQ